eukprot:jgi/Botrbrau1/18899/Bobra.177_2s0057.1
MRRFLILISVEPSFDDDQTKAQRCAGFKTLERSLRRLPTPRPCVDDYWQVLSAFRDVDDGGGDDDDDDDDGGGGDGGDQNPRSAFSKYLSHVRPETHSVGGMQSTYTAL